jgi:hypothetical protein
MNREIGKQINKWVEYKSTKLDPNTDKNVYMTKVASQITGVIIHFLINSLEQLDSHLEKRSN